MKIRFRTISDHSASPSLALPCLALPCLASPRVYQAAVKQNKAKGVLSLSQGLGGGESSLCLTLRLFSTLVYYVL